MYLLLTIVYFDILCVCNLVCMIFGVVALVAQESVVRHKKAIVI